MQATSVTTATTATATAATTTPRDSASDIAGQQAAASNAANATDGDASSVGATAATAATAAASVKISLSPEAQAYLSQPDPPSIAETQRAKKKPRMKQLVELMLEWGKKAEDQRDQQQKAKQLAASQGVAPGNAPTANNIKKIPRGQPIGGDADA
ncbi:MAG TPA: hypothetical protein VGN04_00640 [Herbaspirillum sp.]